MADVEIKYNNSTIASLNDSGTEVFETNGTFLTDDITVEYTKSGGGGVSPSGSLNITENGTYDITNYESVVVDVESNIVYVDYDYTESGNTKTWTLQKSLDEIGALVRSGKVVFIKRTNDRYNMYLGMLYTNGVYKPYTSAGQYLSSSSYVPLEIMEYAASPSSVRPSYSVTSGGGGND